MSVEGMHTRDGDGEEESFCTAGDQKSLVTFDEAESANASYDNDEEDDGDSWNESSEYHAEARETPPSFETSER